MKKIKIVFNRKLIIVLLMALFALFIFNVNVYATDTSFTLEKESIDVTLNGTRFLSYTGGTGLVTWESSDESIAIVENGTVKGHKIGTTTITAIRGEETDTCTVNVVYNFISIKGQSGNNISRLNLVLNEHDTEDLNAIVEDSFYKVVENASVNWSSSDASVVKVDQNGTITGLKAGKATITASAAGVSDTCEVTVVNGPVFTNFSNAKYELLFDTDVDLKITGVTPKEENYYYYIITSNNTKPTLAKTSYGALDTAIVTEANYLSVNTEENYIYARNLDKYVELNQELYLWIIEDVKLEDYYETEESNYISHSTKFVVEGVKLTRPKLPQLNLILKAFNVGSWGDGDDQTTWVNFRFPSATENRKFTIKIGEVTDNNILKKIQNNDYSGITELQTYAKNNKAIYSTSLTTTSENYYSSEQSLFDGKKLLKDDAYYYIYVVFDDENGKYIPIEGVTLGQAWLSDYSDNWDLWAYTSEEFKWNDLSSTYEEPDTTIADKVIPHAGKTTILMIVTTVLIAVLVVSVKKYNKVRDI